MDKPVIDGYVFQYAKDCETAKKELQAVKKIKDRLDENDAESVLKLYEKMVSKKVFETPVGLSFLHEIREKLMQSMPGEDILPVYVPGNVDTDRQNGILGRRSYEKLKKENEKLLAQKRNMCIAIVSMAIVIIGMFFIVVTNDNIGYFNAEEKVLNKYSAWQERLQNWEEELIEREDEIEAAERKLGIK